MIIELNVKRRLAKVSPLIYGQFAEHFHRQIYGGIYDPDSELSDGDGFRMDVIEALRAIHVPVLRWPGGCFASAYHWKDGVGRERRIRFDKAWRVEEANRFGTDEFIAFCRKVGCAPYICTNAGTGSPEEMSDWVEYCNLDRGFYDRLRAKNGHEKPYGVKYWSIGNENWGPWEIGANEPKGWARLVTESAKMMKRTDPSIELSAAALTDMDWNSELLKKAGERLDWISIHGYWDFHKGKNELASYRDCLPFMKDLDRPVRQVRGLLTALGAEHIKIACDEWNLRAWYHPNIMDLYQGLSEEEYLLPRDDNDLNWQYTMADAVFAACFLNMCIRNADAVGMANFSPAVNTRGMIFTHPGGIVLRPVYYVFLLYTRMREELIDAWPLSGEDEMVDFAAARDAEGKAVSIALVNKDPEKEKRLELRFREPVRRALFHSVNGPDCDSFNGIGREQVSLFEGEAQPARDGRSVQLCLSPHSVNLLELFLSEDLK